MGLFLNTFVGVSKKKVQMQTGSRESFSKEGENFHVHFVANYSLCSTRSSVCSQSSPPPTCLLTAFEWRKTAVYQGGTFCTM